MASRAILTHNTFRDCRVHFFRQPFSKELYKQRTTHNNLIYSDKGPVKQVLSLSALTWQEHIWF